MLLRALLARADETNALLHSWADGLGQPSSGKLDGNCGWCGHSLIGPTHTGGTDLLLY